MPWKECSSMSEREEFIFLSLNDQGPMSVLCRRFGISRKTGYKWVRRFKEGGTGNLADRSRRPQNSPRRSDQAIERMVVELRQRHRAWGGRKIKRRLEDLGQTGVCSASTVTAILRRHDLIDAAATAQRQTPRRFEYPSSNDLWQMDFKGHFPLLLGGQCHPLTVLDDHSRYALVLKSCGNEQTATVQGHLIEAFERYGLPRRILCDNGSPWATSGGGGWDNWTPLSLWLLRLGIGMIHGRPYHPQTQGKEERFHATLVAEVLRWQTFENLAATQAAFDPWREIYNTQRPHEALEMSVPATRYHPSPRSYPASMPEVVYPKADLVRKVSGNSGIILHGKRYGIGKAFRGQLVALRMTGVDGVWDVYYCHQPIGCLDERNGQTMSRRASEVDDLSAGDLDEISDASGGEGLLEKFRIENLAALGLANGKLDALVRKILGDRLNSGLSGRMGHRHDERSAVGHVIGGFVPGVVGVVSFQADGHEFADHRAEGNLSGDGEGRTFLNNRCLLLIHKSSCE
jgi:transposase InsO family protein